MESASPESPPARAPGLVPTLAVAAVALAAGLGVGLMVVGPHMASAAPAAEGHDAESGEEAGGHGAPAAAQLFTIDGLIVNPAGSRGQHHLIITVAFEVKDAAINARLRAAEVPLRDALSALLEQRTLDELTAPGVRERLRSDLAPLVVPYAGATPVRVYVPQYIVQ